MMAIVVNGDACKPEDIERAFAAIDGVDAVISTIGGTTADPSADSEARSSAVKTFSCRKEAHHCGNSRPHGAGQGSQLLTSSSQTVSTCALSCSQPTPAGKHQSY